MSSEPDTTRRLREYFAAFPERAAGEDCPAPERIWAAVNGELSPDEAGIVIDHTIDCGECAEAWRLAQELSPEESPDAAAATSDFGAAPVGWRLRLSSWRIPLAVAAALLLLLLAPQLWQRFSDSGRPILRGTDREITSLIPEDEPLPRDRCLLRWSTGPEGSQYGVIVTSEGLDLIAAQTMLQEPRFLVPSEALSGLPDGSPIYWRVETVAPDGARTESPTFISRIK